MTITELQICTCWHFTSTYLGCRAFVETMSELQREAFSFGDLDTVEMIRDASGLAIAKAEIISLSENVTVH